MLYKLDVYEKNAKNFKKNGTLSKRATTALGSAVFTQPDNIEERVKVPIVKHLKAYGYTNIQIGSIDNVLYLERDGKQYLAFKSVKMDYWEHAIMIGFASDVRKNATIKRNTFNFN